MLITTCPDPLALAQAVKRYHKEHRFLIAMEKPDGTIHLYGSNEPLQALIEARTDHPLGTVIGEYEYLPTANLAALAAQAQDPVSRALRTLGEVPKE